MSKLIFPQELEVWYLLPAIRKRLAIALISKGKSQKEVAKTMFLTEAAVSQYKKAKRAQDEFLGTKFDIDFTAAVDKILLNNQSFFPEVMRLNNLIRNSGVLCDLHKKVFAADLPCQSCELNNKVCM